MELILDEGMPLHGDLTSEIVKAMKAALSAALAREGVSGEDGQVSLTLAEPEEIRALNREYRAVDQVTDVLSFPQFDDVAEIPDGPFLLGDVVINPARAREQAAAYGHSYEREMVYLFTHSIFHLLGYDHMEEAEKRRMRAAEEDVMAQVGLVRAAAPAPEKTEESAVRNAPDAQAAGPKDAAQERRGRIPMDERWKELYRQAEAVLPQAYAPYSHFAVGAALLGASGRVYTGVNVENASFGATICAERTACVKAVSEGERSFLALAVVSSRGTAWPCGICRQFLSEFAEDLPVITGDDVEHLEEVPLTELLKKGFTL